MVGHAWDGKSLVADSSCCSFLSCTGLGTFDVAGEARIFAVLVRRRASRSLAARSSLAFCMKAASSNRLASKVFGRVRIVATCFESSDSAPLARGETHAPNSMVLRDVSGDAPPTGLAAKRGVASTPPSCRGVAGLPRGGGVIYSACAPQARPGGIPGDGSGGMLAAADPRS